MPVAGLALDDCMVELRRFAAGLRVITAVLCILLVGPLQPIGSWVHVVLLVYMLWSAALLRQQPDPGPASRTSLIHAWIDVGWTVLLLQAPVPGVALLVLTFVQPVVMAGLLHGTRHGVLMGSVAAAGLIWHAGEDGFETAWILPVLGLLLLSPAAALFARPLGDLRRRIELGERIDAVADPRRGIVALGGTLLECLQEATRAELCALILPGGTKAPALIRTRADGTLRASAAVQHKLAQWLGDLPQAPLASLPGWQERLLRIVGGGRAGHDDAVAAALAELANLLDVDHLVMLPLRRRGCPQGHLLLGYGPQSHGARAAVRLQPLLPLLVDLIEKAELVDELQAETAAHERARIGRDLHDSAIQPYVALKFAVEGLALRADADNPLHDDLQSLAELVQAEVGELRERISQLRSGEPAGDDALLPAVRRQIRRFARLSGIRVHLDGPPDLRSSRALAGAMFHLVNEALNNVRKHTLACNVLIHIEQRADTMVLVIRDDGATIQGSPLPDFQPRSLTERVQELGGSLRIGRTNRCDTEIEIVIPL